MNERIKNLRKSLNMTQEEFSKRIGLSRNFIAQVEIGTKTPSERTISDICREFEVNDEWLRTGTGEMFQPVTKNDEISRLLGNVSKMDDSNFRRRLVNALARLDDDGWTHLEELIDMIAGKK